MDNNSQGNYSQGPNPAGKGLRAQFGLTDASQQREGPGIHLWDAQPEGTSSPFAATSPQPPVFPRKSGFFVFFAVEGAGCAVAAWEPHAPFSFWPTSRDFAPDLPILSEGKRGGRGGNDIP